MKGYCVVLTTLGSEEDAQKMINAILENKLAACLQTTHIGSHYTWNGKVCHDQEVLVLFKTSWALYDTLESKIRELHPYETPEIIAVDIKKGFKEYLDWIDEVTM